MTLPLGLRNRLAELILDAFDDPGARRALCALDAWGHASAAMTQMLETKEVVNIFISGFPLAFSTTRDSGRFGYAESQTAKLRPDAAPYQEVVLQTSVEKTLSALES